MDIQLELICCFMVVVVERYTLCPLFELAWECRHCGATKECSLPLALGLKLL